MKVQVRYFAAIREAIGLGTEEVQTQSQTVAELREELRLRGGAYAEALAQGRAVRTALDQVLCEPTAPLHEGCELAFFPPVTGG
jgi:molybdopterin synthase sulfur carrier subunit